MTRVHEAMRHAGKIGEPVQQPHQSADFVVKESATEALSAHDSGTDTKRPAAPEAPRPPARDATEQSTCRASRKRRRACDADGISVAPETGRRNLVARTASKRFQRIRCLLHKETMTSE